MTRQERRTARWTGYLPAQQLVCEPTGAQRCHGFVDIASPNVVLNEEGRITGGHQLIEG